MSMASFVSLISRFAYTLQLSIKKSLFKCKDMDIAVGHFCNLVKKMNYSIKLPEALASTSASLKEELMVAKVNFETPWNITWTMLNSVLTIRKYLELLRRIRGDHDGYCDFTISPTFSLASAVAAESWFCVRYL